MATIQKRKRKNGTYSYRVMIRQSDGYPPKSRTFPTKQEIALGHAQRAKSYHANKNSLPSPKLTRKREY